MKGKPQGSTLLLYYFSRTVVKENNIKKFSQKNDLPTQNSP